MTQAVSYRDLDRMERLHNLGKERSVVGRGSNSRPEILKTSKEFQGNLAFSSPRVKFNKEGVYSNSKDQIDDMCPTTGPCTFHS